MTLLTCDCGKTLQVPDGTAARRGKCPACGRILALGPAASASAPAELPVSVPTDLPVSVPAELPVSVPTVRATLRGHRGAIAAVAWSPDGQLLATAAGSEASAAPEKSRSGEVLIWNAANGQPLTSLAGHRDCVGALAFSADSNVLLTGSKDHSVGVWDVSRGLHDSVIGVREQSLRGHTARVTSVTFQPGGNLVASGGEDPIIRLWDRSTWQVQSTLDSARRGPCHLAFSPCGSMLAGVWSSRGPAKVWEVATGRECLQLRLRSEEDFEDYAVAFTHDGTRLAVLSADEVRLWDLGSCQVLVSFAAAGVKSLAASPVGRMLATGGWEVSTHVGIRLWDSATGGRLHELQGHNLPVSAVAFSADGRRLASGSRDMTVKLWALPAT